MSHELIYGSLYQSVIIKEEGALVDHSYQSAAASYDLAPQPSTSNMPKTNSYKGPLSKAKFPAVYLCGKCAEDLEDEPEDELDESIECSKSQKVCGFKPLGWCFL